jgi:predicted flap endonuclease-1-like 5' DNA nuclease
MTNTQNNHSIKKLKTGLLLLITFFLVASSIGIYLLTNSNKVLASSSVVTPVISTSNTSTESVVTTPVTTTPATQSTPTTVKSTTPSPLVTNTYMAGLSSKDGSIKGTANGGAKISLSDQNGSIVPCKTEVVADQDGKFICDLVNPLLAQSTVNITATLDGQNTSSPTIIKVMEPYVPVVINGNDVTFNTPEGLKVSSEPNKFGANFDFSSPDWKYSIGSSINGLQGISPVVLTKDSENYLSFVLSNQNPNTNNTPTTVIALDQKAMDTASGVENFKPVEIASDPALVRIPNLSTKEVGDWWYIPKSMMLNSGYKATNNDAQNFGTDNATIGFYKNNLESQIKPQDQEQFDYAFSLAGVPKAFSVPNNFAFNLKTNSPENLLQADSIVAKAKFPTLNGFNLKLPEVKLPKNSLTTPILDAITPNKGFASWLWLLLLALLALLLWLLWLLKNWLQNNWKLGESNMNTIVDEQLIDYSSTVNNQVMSIDRVAENTNLKTDLSTNNLNSQIVIDPEFKATENTSREIGYNSPVFTPVSESEISETNLEPGVNTKFSPFDQEIEPLNIDTSSQQEVVSEPMVEPELVAVQPVLNIEPSIPKPMNFAATLNEVKSHTNSNMIDNAIKVGAITTAAIGATVVAKSSYDNFEIIEGIGPKINRVLHSSGINTFEDLCNTSEDELKEILKAKLTTSAITYPHTWPVQAKLAMEAKWDELETYKKELYKGVA